MNTNILQSVKKHIGVPKVRRVLVTERDVKRFLQAIGDSEQPAPGERSLVAPPLFYQTMSYDDVPIEELPVDGSPLELDVPIPPNMTVGGSSEFQILRCAEVGDQVEVSTCLSDVFTKEGRTGVLYFVVVETEFRDEIGGLMALETATYIKRLR